MKIKKYLGLLVLLLTVALTGCDNLSVTHNIDEVEMLLAKFGENTAVDMSYTVDIRSQELAGIISGRVRFKSDEEIALIGMSDGNELVQMYYLEGLSCTVYNDQYDINKVSFNDIYDEVPVPTKFDFEKYRYKLDVKNHGEEVVYTIEIRDSDIKDLVEEISGITLEDTNIKMTLVMIADQNNMDLKTMQINFEFKHGIEEVTMNMSVIVNAVGEEVVLEIPEIVSQKIDEYLAEPGTRPTPKPIVYEDTRDGVVQYHQLGAFNKVLYDCKTDKFVVLRNKSIDIYNASTMTIEREITFLMTPYCIDVENGKMVVGYREHQFTMYDLTNYNSQTYQTNIKVSEIVMDGDMVIYADDNQWCNIVFHNINTDKKVVRGTVYQPLLTINREDHILYVTETGISSSDLIYYYSQTGEQIYASAFSQFSYVKNRIYFNGKVIHHEGKTFNRFTAEVVSSSYLTQTYPQTQGFTPSITLYETNQISFVGGSTDQHTIYLFNHANDEYIYSFSFTNGEVFETKDGKYIMTSTDQKYIAIVDVSLIDAELVVDDKGQDSNDKALKTLATSVYTKSIVDDKYIYTLNESNHQLRVYDIQTLTEVFSTTFLIQPISIDAHSNRLVIGFGDACQFKIYNVTTWEYETIITAEPVFSTIIYKDRIIYSEVDQHCRVYSYNMISKKHASLDYYGYYISMAINREDGIIYFGDSRSSSCDLVYFNLETNKKIYESPFSTFVYSGTNIRFDGNFVHYADATFDKTTGLKISNTDLARQYVNIVPLTSIETIYDDTAVSVFTGVSNGEYYTVVYDLLSNTQVHTSIGKATHAMRVDNTIVVLNNANNIIKTITL